VLKGKSVSGVICGRRKAVAMLPDAPARRSVPETRERARTEERGRERERELAEAQEAVRARLVREPLVRYWLLESHPRGGAVQSREAAERALAAVAADESFRAHATLSRGWWSELHYSHSRARLVDDAERSRDARGQSSTLAVEHAVQAVGEYVASISPFCVAHDGTLFSWCDAQHALARRESLLLCEDSLHQASHRGSAVNIASAVDSVRAVVSMQSETLAEVMEANRLSNGDIVLAVCHLARTERRCFAFRFAAASDALRGSATNAPRADVLSAWDVSSAVVAESCVRFDSLLPSKVLFAGASSFTSIATASHRWENFTQAAYERGSHVKWNSQLVILTYSAHRRHDFQPGSPRTLFAATGQLVLLDEVVSVGRYLNEVRSTDRGLPGLEQTPRVRDQPKPWTLPKLSATHSNRRGAPLPGISSPDAMIPRSSISFEGLHYHLLNSATPAEDSNDQRSDDNNRRSLKSKHPVMKRQRPASGTSIPSRNHRLSLSHGGALAASVDSGGQVFDSMRPLIGVQNSQSRDRAALPRMASLDDAFDDDTPRLDDALGGNGKIAGSYGAYRPESLSTVQPRPGYLSGATGAGLPSLPYLDSQLAIRTNALASSSFQVTNLAQQLDKAALRSFDLERYDGEKQRLAQLHAAVSAVGKSTDENEATAIGSLSGGDRSSLEAGRVNFGSEQDHHMNCSSSSSSSRSDSGEPSAEKRSRELEAQATSARQPRAKKAFVCSICHNVYPRKTNLQRHVQMVHEKSKPFKCDECDEVFGTVSNLRRHVKGKHLNLKPYPCSQCDSRFVQSSDLKRHVERKHASQPVTTAVVAPVPSSFGAATSCD